MTIRLSREHRMTKYSGRGRRKTGRQCISPRRTLSQMHMMNYTRFTHEKATY